MEALTDQKLIHRDLALRNVLVFSLNVADCAATSVKVADFGLMVNSYTAGNYVEGGSVTVHTFSPLHTPPLPLSLLFAFCSIHTSTCLPYSSPYGARFFACV